MITFVFFTSDSVWRDGSLFVITASGSMLLRLLPKMSRFRSYFPQQVLTAIDAGSRVNMLLPLLFLGMVAHVGALAIEIEPLYDKCAEERGFAAKEGHTGYGVVHAREAGPSTTPELPYNGQHDGHGWYGHGPANYRTFSDVHARDAYAAPDPARPQW